MSRRIPKTCSRSDARVRGPACPHRSSWELTAGRSSRAGRYERSRSAASMNAQAPIKLWDVLPCSGPTGFRRRGCNICARRLSAGRSRRLGYPRSRHACRRGGRSLFGRSKQDCFAFDSLTGVRQCRRGHDMHRASEQVLQVALQRSLLEQAPSPISTSTSKSLPGPASPRGTDPNTRTARAP
jgi:hypothetical protein